MPKLLPNLRQTLIEKAIELSRTGGLSGLKLRDLARECNIALGTLYNYYPTKDLSLIHIFSDFVITCPGFRISSFRIAVSVRVSLMV